VAAGLLVSLLVLLGHARVYEFLTDDAYISFRYARNFAEGFGLVFNPGYERVEGYSNFLWVMLLAGLNRLGIPSEFAANPLSIAMTIGLWAVVVWFARRLAPPGREWLVLVPAFGLALTRSVAVWSTSGLETRCFELLVVSGVLRLVVELESLDAGRERKPVASVLLALATLTRPDGLLIAGCAYLIAAGWLMRSGWPVLFRFARRQWPFLALVVLHLGFRRLYYDDWLPNTYYAKVGGHHWWSSGFRYLAAFVLEYGLILWVPLMILAFRPRTGERVPLFAWMAVGVVLPHTLYILAIGGDHFEFRPFDVYFPLGFLLLELGIARWLEFRVRPYVMAGALALLALSLTLIPWESHRQFVNHYQPGYPGAQIKDDEQAARFLSPDRDPILRLPVLRSLATVHRDLTRWMTLHFVAIRQEEHRMFLATAIPEGRKLGNLREIGLLPKDTYIALDCVGAIPYYSRLRTLDRLGLTDAHVAHSPMIREAMAHGKSATLDYARERGVDLWSIDPVHLIVPLTSMRMLVAVKDGYTIQRPYFAVDAGPEGYLICELPGGIERARRRLPGLKILSFGDSSFIRNFLLRSRGAYSESLAIDPFNLRAARNLGYLMLLAEDYVPARYHYQVMTRSYPTLLEGFENLALCNDLLGLRSEAIAAANHAMSMAQSRGDTAAIRRINDRFVSINSTGPAPASKAR
jgi:arabinofuranosyltransferase